MNDQTAVSITFTNKVNGEKKLERYAESLKKVNTFLNAIDTSKASAVESLAKDTNKLANADTNKNLKELGSNFSNVFNAGKIIAFTKAFERTIKEISTYTKKTADFLENWNLLDVAFQNNTTEAEKFVNTLSEMYGLDESWGYRTVGLFKQLANAMGLTDEVGTKLSKTLTQLAIDTSSLYNINIEDTVSILQSGLAGQTKPVRRLGGDITQTTLQLTLDAYGIEETINQLTYAEKRLVIVTALLNQTEEASGDWGRTIESVANQMRIFQQQVERLTRAIGNVFLPILKTILPYMNAILMVLTEIISWIATLVGYDPKEFDYFSGATQDIYDFKSGIDGTNDSVKKLKSGLRGFDKLNVIKTPSSSGGGSGGRINGVDPKILEMFNQASNNYLESLEKVQMKATKIRDSIMEWLGFTKLVDETTGDVSFKLKDGYSNLKLIGGIIATISGLKLISGIKGLITGTSKLGKLLGTGGLYTKLSAILKPIKILGAKDGLHYIFLVAKDKLVALLPKLGKFAGVIGGIVAAIKGAGGVNDAMKEFSKTTEEGSKSLKDYYANLTLTVGGATLVGALIGNVPGALIGAITGAVTVGISAINGYIKGLNNLSEETQKNFKEMEEPLVNFSKNIKELEFKANLEIDDETEKKVISSLDALTKKISDKVISSKNQTIEDINSLVENGFLTVEEQKDAQKKVENYYGKISNSTDLAKKRINEIIKKANKENRKLEEKELSEITALYETLKNNTINIVTTSETEQSILYEKFADSKLQISKDVASEMIKDAIAIKDETIKNAEEQYVETLNKAENMYKIGAINEETYKKIKEEAKKTKDETIKNAKEQYDTIYDEFKKNHEDIAGYIDRDDGHVKSSWEKFWDELPKKLKDFGKKLKQKVTEIWNDIKKWWNETVVSWLDNHVFKYFTKKFWTEKLNEVKNAIKDFKFPKIKLNVTYDTDVGETKKAIYEALGLKGWPRLSISTYAKGGLPSVGQLFVANERGPELVGQIGGQSFVANQNQMMSLLDKKINGSNNGKKVFNIYLDEGHMIASYTLDELESMAKSNGEPITIGG